MKVLFSFLLTFSLVFSFFMLPVQAAKSDFGENNSHRIRSEILEGRKRINAAERYKLMRERPPRKPTGLRNKKPFPFPHKDEIFFYGTYVTSSFDVNDRASAVQVQVGYDTEMKNMVWDSGKRDIKEEVRKNQTVRFQYDGDSLRQDGSVYYWRMKVWNGKDVEGAWSYVNSQARFKMNNSDPRSKILNQYSPQVPDNLRVNGMPVDRKADGAPVFSARFQDKDSGDKAVYYEVEVSTHYRFKTEPVWLSGKVKFDPPVERFEQSQGLPYEGPDLVQDGRTRYYWRVKFYDLEDKSSEWSNLGLFIMKKMKD
jgi:hypothetical protein